MCRQSPHRRLWEKYLRVFLFGAGASHSYSESPTGVRPPLAKNFFKAFNDLDISGDSYVRIGDVVNYVRDRRHVVVEKFINFNEDIETFLSEVEARIHTPAAAQALDFGERLRCIRTYDQSVLLFCAVLNEIQNGPTAREYSSLVRQLQNDDVLITLNWDTLLDRALSDSTRWFVDDGYDVQFEMIFESSYRKAIRSRSQWTLLKLHGSTNWFIPYHTRHLQTGHDGALAQAGPFCFVNAPNGYPTYKDRARTGYAPFSYFYYPPSLGSETNGIPTMPLIVPPIREKDYTRLAPFLDALWHRAQVSIKKCDELFIIGYSFPSTDIRAWSLIQQLKNRHDLLVHLIDPYPDAIATRLRKALSDEVRIDVRAQVFDGTI
jgi:hypothetical protein